MGKTKTINKSKRCSKSQPSLPQASLTSPLHNKILLLEEIYQETNHKSLTRLNSVLNTLMVMLQNANEWLFYTVLIIWMITPIVRLLLQHSSRAITEIHEKSAYSSQSNLTTARL